MCAGNPALSTAHRKDYYYKKILWLTDPHLREVSFDAPLTRAHVEALGTCGKLTLMDSFRPAFFKIEQPDRFVIKGIEGKTTLRIDSFGQPLEQTIDLMLIQLNEVFHDD